MAADSKSEGEYGERVRALLRDAIQDEIGVAAAMMNRVELGEQFIERLAWAVATRLDYAFQFRWNPDWLKPGDIHAWSEDAEWFARCGVCLADSPPSKSNAEAKQWVRGHRLTEHGP